MSLQERFRETLIREFAGGAMSLSEVAAELADEAAAEYGKEPERLDETDDGADLADVVTAAGIREDAARDAARNPGGAGMVLRALSRRARRLDDELAACRKRETERDEALKQPGASSRYGDAVMLFNAEGNLTWNRIVPTGENLAEDLTWPASVRHIELLRQAPPPPQELMEAQLVAIREWSGWLAGDPRRNGLLAILNWQQVPADG